MWMMGAFFHTFSLLNERHLEEVSLVCDSEDTGSAGRIYIVSTNSAKGGRILFWFMKD
jgi:hypothetical protein